MASVWTRLNEIKQLNMVNVPGGLTYKQVRKKYPRADIISSLTLFVLANNLNFVYFEDENIKDGYLGGEGIGIRNEKELVWCSAKQAYDDKTIRDFCSGFPTIVKDGEVNIDWGNKYSAYVDGKHRRLLTGFNKGLLIIVATDNKITLHEAADIMVRFGCDYAINGDGGNYSPHLEKHKKIIRKGSRKNPTWLLVYLDKTKAFVDLVKSLIGSEYIYGTNGEITTSARLRQLISWFGSKHYKTRYFDASNNVDNDVLDVDCSGLFVYVLRKLGLITGDYSASMLYNQLCYPIDKSELRNGDLVFYESLGHVGMYYEGEVIEARGTNYGVIISDRLSAFSKYGRIKYL